MNNKEIYGPSLGNLISAYWTIRAYSIYNKIDFNFINYLKIGNTFHESYNTILNHFFKFFKFKIKYNLNKDSNICSDINIIDEYSCEILNIKMKININKFIENVKFRKLLYFSHQYLGGWTDIIPLIQNESLKNINNYLKYKKIDKPFYSNNETVIHFRCGNVLIGHANPNYPILKFSYFRDNIDSNCQKITIIWKIDYDDKNTEIETGEYERDLLVITELKKYLENNLNIEVNIKNQYFSDFIYMFYAPKLITSPSSFSFWPAVMSNREAVVPKCKLFCANQTPFLRNNFHWIDCNNYRIDADKIYASKNKNQDLIKLLQS